MVGNTSLTDCDTNRAFYESQKIGVIGVGPQPSCYSQPNWTPINSGPYVSNQILLKFAYDDLEAQNVCVVGQNEPTSIPSWKLQIADFEKESGKKLALVSFANDPTQNPTPHVVKAKSAGCDALILHTVPPNFVAFVKAAKSVGLNASILCLGSAYDESVPKSLGKLAEPGALGDKSKGLFVSSELAPWTTDDPALTEMKAGLKAAGVPLNFWSQGGWLTAEMFVNGVKGKLEGDVSRDSVLKALQEMEPFETPQAGSPLVFGPDDKHSPNLSARMVTIKGGEWATASDDWTTVALPRFASSRPRTETTGADSMIQQAVAGLVSGGVFAAMAVCIVLDVSHAGSAELRSRGDGRPRSVRHALHVRRPGVGHPALGRGRPSGRRASRSPARPRDGALVPRGERRDPVDRDDRAAGDGPGDR